MVEFEKIFSFNRWFVGFCALLVIFWVALQFVANERVAQEGKKLAQQILSWHFVDAGFSSGVVDLKAKVKKRSDTAAVVEVTGQQIITVNSETVKSRHYSAPCRVQLKLYKDSNRWYLGCVELK